MTTESEQSFQSVLAANVYKEALLNLDYLQILLTAVLSI
jgi:hypothetical protein